ncbi:Decaprenyl diphosphate synthase-like protein [Lyophyllum atratum]|nr:Decaprenyl diphosphate synthase-like protein [Lyophyllum atratum]
MHNDLLGTVNMPFQPVLTWLRNLVADIAQSFLLTVLAAGPIPKHVAFILDGNRRYARSRQKRVIDGHSAGYLVFRSMFDICLRLGITCVSAYVFSRKSDRLELSAAASVRELPGQTTFGS